MSEKLIEIIDGLNNKAALKQHIYRNTITVFEQFKKCVSEIADKLTPEVISQDKSLEVGLSEIGEFEFHLKFSGDTIAFIMHTNVFSFPPEHEVSKSSYVDEAPDRGYCGMIQAYNFLSDSLKYRRLGDIGYLLARIFINCEGHIDMGSCGVMPRVGNLYDPELELDLPESVICPKSHCHCGTDIYITKYKDRNYEPTEY